MLENEEVKEEYFIIDEGMLAEEAQAYPFHLFVYNPTADVYSPFLPANKPLEKEKYDILRFILDRGGELAVSIRQKNTFLSDRELDENQVPSLRKSTHHPLNLKREEVLNQIDDYFEKKGTFVFKKELGQATDNDDFTSLIEVARMEIMGLPVTRSYTVSLASYLAENLLIEDNYINRMVALSYHLTKGSGMDDEQALGDLICAAFFSHLGQTQMDYELSHIPSLKLDDQQLREYKKHPLLSQHVVRKSGVLISERCNTIMIQHHERYDGNGYPDHRKGEFIDPLALVLGAATHILEHFSGKITGEKTNMRVIITNLREKILTPGLEMEFGDSIYNSLSYLLDENAEEESSAEAA
jgi:hypothetical protein